MNTAALPFVLSLFVFALPGQDGAPAAKQPLVEKLRATATGPGAEFRVQWRWPRVVTGSATRQVSGGNVEQKAGGSWRGDVLHVALDRGSEVVLAGRHTIVRAPNGPWLMGSLGSGALPDLVYVPDPQRLMLALAETAPEVSNREIVEVDGRPVERFSATLGAAQTDLLVSAGVVHDPNPFGGQLRRMLAARGQAGRAKAPNAPPLDVVVECDVATGEVVTLRLRAVVDAEDVPAALRRALQRRPGAAPAEEEPEEPEPGEQQPADGAPAAFENGFPVRDTKDKTVHTLTVTITGHGKATVELDAEQRRLLGR